MINPAIFNDVLIFAVITTGAVIVLNQLARMLRTGMLHRSIRAAIQKDSPAVSRLVEAVDEKPAETSDDRTGLVLIALAVAIFCSGLIGGDPAGFRQMAAISLFPLCVGAALLGRFIYLRRAGGA